MLKILLSVSIDLLYKNAPMDPPPMPRANLTYDERRILLSTSYGHFISHFNMLVFPAVALPISVYLKMDLVAVLELSFIMYLLFGLTALPWGLAADRWGAFLLFRIYYLGAGFSAFAAAFYMDSPDKLPWALAGIGFFSGIYHPAGLGLISKTVQRVSIGMGINGMFGNLGLATAPVAAGLLNWMWGPRAVYIALGCINLLGLILMRLTPWELSTGENKTQSAHTGGMVRPFLILLVAMMLGGIVYRGATVITPAFFELKLQGFFEWMSRRTAYPLSNNLIATGITSMIFLIGTLGQYCGGKIADRYDPRYSLMLFHAVTIPAAVLMVSGGEVMLVLLAFVFFFFLLGMQPIENTLVARLTPPRLHHSAYGTKFVLTFGVGALAVRLVGVIERSYHLGAVYYALAIGSCFIVVAVFFLIVATQNDERVHP